MPDLDQLLADPGGLRSDGVIYAKRPWRATTDAVVVDGESAPVGYVYLLEVDVAHDVLEVWSAWRGGQRPTAAEAAEAVIHYAEHDAYLPTTGSS